MTSRTTRRYLFLWLACLIPVGGVDAQNAAQEGYAPSGVAELKLSSYGFPRILFDPSGTRLAVALSKGEGEDGKIAFLNVPDLEVIREVVTDTEPYALAFSPTGDQFALSVAPGKSGDHLRFAALAASTWDTAYSDKTLKFAVSSLAYDPVGDLLFVGGTDNRELLRFEVGTWKSEGIPALREVDEGCQALALSPDGQHCAMGTYAGNLFVWPMNDTAPAKRLGTRAFEGEIPSAAFSADSKFLAAGDARGNLMVFYRTDDDLWAWKAKIRLPNGGVNGLAFLADNSVVTLSSSGDLARWNIDDPEALPVETMNVGAENARALAVDAKRNWMALGGDKIFLYPIGAPLEASEMPSAPLTVVESKPPPMTEEVEEVPSVPLQAPAVSPAAKPAPDPDPEPDPDPTGEGLQKFLIWLASGKDAGPPRDWVQSWAAFLDTGLYDPFQIDIPFDTLNADVFRSNLEHIKNVHEEGDFLVSYVGGVLSPPDADGSFRISVGPYTNERVGLMEWIKTLEAASAGGPVVWMLDLIPDPSLSDGEVGQLVNNLVSFIALAKETVPEGEAAPLRDNIGVGLVTVSMEGCYEDLLSRLRPGLSGKADRNDDGVIYDRELMIYLGDHCHGATRVTPVGNPKNPLPMLPQFRLDAAY